MIPKILKTQEEYEAALQVVGSFIHAEPATRDADALELWVHLIEEYEERTHPLHPPSPMEAVRFRMSQMGLKPIDLVPFIGCRSKVSEVLNGRRPLSLAMMRRLHEGLGIPLEILMQTTDPVQMHES